MPQDDRGIYVLVIDFKKKLDIKVGQLGIRTFLPGKYLYVGRAKQYLGGRLKRHLRKDKKNFWHIDYLLQESQIEDIWIKHNVFDECRIAATILSQCKEESLPIQGFGSSDCRCPSHLIHFTGHEGGLPKIRKNIEFKKAGIHEN
ncbi:DUF123 domain-containing protein [Acidobacteriota bacterium]